MQTPIFNQWLYDLGFQSRYTGAMPNYTRDQARAHIAQLVQQFQQSQATLLHSEKTMIENNFICPLFRCLNWNVDNTGLAEPQWEFVLQLDGQKLFVMDVKKVICF